MKHNEQRERFLKEFKEKFPKFKIILFTGIKKPIIVEDENGWRYKKNNCDNILKIGFSFQSLIEKEKFIEVKLKQIHPNLKLISYNGLKKPIIVEDENGFKYSPQCYDLLNGHKVTIETSLNKEELFKFKANIKHSSFYTYEDFNYINGKQKIKIKCPVHGSYEQIIESHLAGHGCKKCNTIGFSKESWVKRLKNKKAYFYIIKVYNKNEKFVKIGITSTNIKERYRNLKEYKYKIIKTLEGEPSMIYDLEKEYLKKYKTFKYYPKLSFEGKTECFTTKILTLI